MSDNISLKSVYRQFRNTVTHFVYYLRCMLVSKYNVIKIRRLPPTWTDCDTILHQFIFQLLEDFIEKEQPYGDDFSEEAMLNHIAHYLETGFQSDQDRYDVHKSLIKIYRWIKDDFDRYECRLKSLYSSFSVSDDPLRFTVGDLKVYELVEAEEARQDKEIEETMMKIIKLRHYLWT